MTLATRSGSTARSPLKARDTVLGLTPAASATSFKVMRPVDRWFLGRLADVFKGLSEVKLTSTWLG
jgi:hypothetical protein